MRRITLSLLILLTLLVSAPANGAWNQWGGDPQRSGVADLPEEPLDVVSTFQLFEEEGRIVTTAAGLVDTPYGLTGLLETPSDGPPGLEPTSQCTLFRLTDPILGEQETLSTYPCENGGKMLGYDPVRDLLFLSIEAPLPDDMLRAVHAVDGTSAWSMGPTLDVPATPGVQDQGEWWLDDLVIVEQEALIYAAFGSDGGPHSIEAIDLETQTSLWQARVPASAMQNLYTFEPLVPVVVQDPSHFPAIAMISVTRTTTGIVSILEGIQGSLVAWFDFEGNWIGAWDTRFVLPPDPMQERDPASHAPRAAASANLAVASVGEQLVYIDPASPSSEFVDRPGQGQGGGINLPSPLWVGEHVFAPTQTEAYIHDPDRGELSHWSGFQSATIGGMVGTPDGDVLAMVDLCCNSGAPDPLVRIDLDQARTVHTLPVSDLGDGRARLQLTPLSDPPGLLAWHDQTGRAALLAVAEERLKPKLTLSTAYPGVNAPVELEALAPGAGVLHVGWGDGRRTQMQVGQTATTTFDEPGLRTLRVTAVFDDGTTATTETVLHVGGTPPQNLNLIQQAFDPENYDLTFGVLGILIALFGGLFALYRHQRGRSRIARELQALEKAYIATKSDPIACETALAERKAHARGIFADGKLNETQFAVLDRRIDELGSAHRMEAIEDRFAFLSVGMARTLREMLADGRISDWERDHFIEALEHDNHLTKGQKTKVRKQVEAWFDRDKGVEA